MIYVNTLLKGCSTGIPLQFLQDSRGNQNLFILQLPSHIHPQALPGLLGQRTFKNHAPLISSSHSHLGEAVKKEVTLVFFRSLIGLFRAALEGTFPAWPDEDEGALGNWGRTEGGPAWGVLPVHSRGRLGSTNQYSNSLSPWFRFLGFQLPAIHRGRKILNGKFQKKTIHRF